MAAEAYVPGVCNINLKEIAYRRKVMIGALILTAALFVIVWALRVHPAIRSLILFLPLFVGAINYLQVKNRFCVSYGASGQQNATKGSETATKVARDADRRADKQKARRMNLQALAGTLVILGLLMLIPA